MGKWLTEGHRRDTTALRKEYIRLRCRKDVYSMLSEGKTNKKRSIDPSIDARYDRRAPIFFYEVFDFGSLRPLQKTDRRRK